MTCVPVQENPETSCVWDPVVERLREQDLLVLDLAAAWAAPRVLELDGLDPWWLLEDPAGAARQLQAFWASLEETV